MATEPLAFARCSPTTARRDESVDVYFGPLMRARQEKNWIRTVAGKGWFPIFRFYGPLQPLYDKSWVLSDIEKLN